MTRRYLLSRLTKIACVLGVGLAVVAMRSASAEPLRPGVSSAGADSSSYYMGWSSLGAPPSTSLYAPARGVNADGRQEIFALSPFVWHAWQTSVNGSWSGWAQHGYLQAYCLAVRANSDGRMEVFAVEQTAQQVWHTWQNAPNAPFSSDPYWDQFPSFGITFYCPLTTGWHSDARINLFTVGSDGKLWSKSQLAPSGGWAPWFSLGFPSGVSINQPAWARDYYGAQYIFVHDSLDRIDFLYQPAGTDTWGGWLSLGHPSGVLLGAPAAAWNNDGRVEVFAVGDDGNLWHSYQIAPGGVFTIWGSMGSPAGGLYAYSKPVAGWWDLDGSGWKMDVFVQKYSGDFWHISQSVASDGWESWSNIGYPPYYAGMQDPAAGKNADGSLILFAAGIGGTIWQNHQGQPPPAQNPHLYLPLVIR